MEFRDLPKQYRVLKSQIDAAMMNVASSAQFISGSEVKELEKKLAEYVGVKHCITCANGTDAISIAMRVWGVGNGDAVFVPDFTFFPLVNARRMKAQRLFLLMLIREHTISIQWNWKGQLRK